MLQKANLMEYSENTMHINGKKQICKNKYNKIVAKIDLKVFSKTI